MASSSSGQSPTRRATTPPSRSTIWIPPEGSILTCSSSTTSRDSRPAEKSFLIAKQGRASSSARSVALPGIHALLPDDMEYQFGAPAHRSRRQIPQIGEARRAVPQENQMHRRRLSPEAFSTSRLRARRTERAERLSRRRGHLEAAV